VIQAWSPITTSYDPDDPGNLWTSTVVTETILTQFVTYMSNSTIETVLTETQTANQTKTVIGTANETITHQTPTFRIEATPGVFLTVDAGPTYVIYNNISGGLNYYTESSGPGFTYDPCLPSITALENWQPAETATEDWSYFISTHTGTEELYNSPTNNPYPLPSELIDFLKQDPDVQSQFSGVDIATCTPEITYGSVTFAPSSAAAAPTGPARSKVSAIIPPFASLSMGTFISTTYESTSVHVTVRGCLRCENTQPLLEPSPTEMSNKDVKPIASSTHVPDQPSQSKTRPTLPDTPAENTAKPTQSKPVTTPGIPPVIKTFVHNPSIWTRQTPAVTVTKSVTIGGVVVPIKTARPTQDNANGPSEQNQDAQSPAPPVIIIGSDTFTPGQTKTMNGVSVVVPTNGGGTRIVVDGSTVAYNPSAPTRGPVLTVGGGTITANLEGEFVFGTETLRPGGPAVTVVGHTISLGPSGVAIINGLTQTINNAPAPTAAPVVMVGGQTVSATVVRGSTVFVVAPGQTLAPGGELVVDGTTFSMPADSQGSTIVVNGQTSTLSAGQSALTLADGHPVSATVIAGSTVFVIAPGQTLAPGGVLTVDGTTYSMPVDGYGSTIVVNGQTSTLGVSQSVLTLSGGQAITATTIGGITAYILASSQTLTPGGVLTISGTTYSMPASASGSVVVVNGATSTLSAADAIITAAPALTIDGITFTYTVRDGTIEYVLGEGITLAPGSAVVVDGTTYSLDAAGTALVVDGKTSSISKLPKSTHAVTTSVSISSVDTNGRNVVSSVGESSRAAAVPAYQAGLDKWVEGLVMGIAGWLVML
jgi:hypothetical protein